MGKKVIDKEGKFNSHLQQTLVLYSFQSYTNGDDRRDEICDRVAQKKKKAGIKGKIKRAHSCACSR